MVTIAGFGYPCKLREVLVVGQTRYVVTYPKGQKEKPRSRRMSRHLYDIERIMNTGFGEEALRDTKLYSDIVKHREKFYHLGYVDYDKNMPEKISFVPKGAVLDEFRKDYEENMVNGYIYDDAVSFDMLISRLEELQENIREIKL